MALLALLVTTTGCPSSSVLGLDPKASNDGSMLPDQAADEQAPGANDGTPCAKWGRSKSVARIADPGLQEISGLVVSRTQKNLLWVIEDSRTEAMVYGVTMQGAVVAKVRLEGAENFDWEDIASGPCPAGTCLVVADTGDNLLQRKNPRLYRFTEPDLSQAAADGRVHGRGNARGKRATLELTVTPEMFSFRDPNGPQDAEAVAIAPTGEALVFTKRKDDTTHLFAVALKDAQTQQTATLIGILPTGGGDEGTSAQATAADLWPDGSRLLLRTYLHLWEWDLTGKSLKDAPTIKPQELGAALEPQGEAAAYDVLGRGIVHTSEGTTPPLYRKGCRR